jgi:chromosome segregation ATPase
MKSPEDMTLQELEAELPGATKSIRAAERSVSEADSDLSDAQDALDEAEDELSQARSYLENIEEQLINRRSGTGWYSPEETEAGLRDLTSRPSVVIGAMA